MTYTFVKKIALILSVMLATTCLVSQSYGQGSLAPLYLFTTGSGSITPLQDEQLLEIGQSYDMAAIPDSGFVFSNWQPANVFVFAEVVMDSSGNLSTNTSIVPSIIPDFTETPSLTFTMQPAQVIFDDPGVLTITQSRGWQANFEPVPEPSETALMTCGYSAFILLRRINPRRLPKSRTHKCLINKAVSDSSFLRHCPAATAVGSLTTRWSSKRSTRRYVHDFPFHAGTGRSFGIGPGHGHRTSGVWFDRDGCWCSCSRCWYLDSP